MNTAEIIALIISGLLVGFINTLAGGGTIITVSLLLFLGFPPTMANGTNRLAVVFQTLVSVILFKRQQMLDMKKGLHYSIPAVAGSLIGAFVAARFEESALQKVIALVMVLMLFVLLIKPERWLKGKPELLEKKVSPFQLVIFFLIGLYGGFIHIGVGFFILAGLVLSGGYDLMKATALKNLIVLAYAPFALLIFALNDQVDWGVGLILSIGNVIGAFIATRYAVKWGTNFIRYVIIFVIIITTLQLLNIIDFRAMFTSLLG